LQGELVAARQRHGQVVDEQGCLQGLGPVEDLGIGGYVDEDFRTTRAEELQLVEDGRAGEGFPEVEVVEPPYPQRCHLGQYLAQTLESEIKVPRPGFENTAAGAGKAGQGAADRVFDHQPGGRRSRPSQLGKSASPWDGAAFAAGGALRDRQAAFGQGLAEAGRHGSGENLEQALGFQTTQPTIAPVIGAIARNAEIRVDRQAVLALAAQGPAEEPRLGQPCRTFVPATERAQRIDPSKSIEEGIIWRGSGT